MPATQSKNWVFTLNNPETATLPATLPYKFITWQAETGENGTPHLQGYVIFETKKTLTAVKSLLPRAHWEVRKGTHDEAVAYCNKVDTRSDGPWTYGIPPQPGKRTDLEDVAKLIQTGSTLQQVAEIYPVQFIKYHRGFTALKLALTKPRSDPPTVIVYYGPTGTGKSHRAQQTDPDPYWLPQGKWFDNYFGQETCIIDEFYGWLPYAFLLRLLDRYPMLVETKGGHVQFVSRRIIFTSNKPPWEWYSSSCDSAPLCRRINEIYAVYGRDGPVLTCEWPRDNNGDPHAFPAKNGL